MPRKAYLEFDDKNRDDDFRFFLAYKLKKFVWEIDQLPHEEFMRWSVWLGREGQKSQLARG